MPTFSHQGIWADSDEDEGESRTGFGVPRRKGFDYTEDMNFVSSGFKKSRAEEKADEAENEVSVHKYKSLFS